MKTLHLALGTACLLVAATTAFSYATGALPGTNGVLGLVAQGVARQAPGCGQCHTGPLPSTVVVNVNPAARTFPPNQQIAVSTTISGGVMAPGKEDWGGFVNEVTAGAFTAGSTSKTDASGAFITHNFSFTGQRNWQYTYTAPATPGLVELYAAANTVNGDGLPTGDMWGFHGDPSGQVSVPVRLYVNAPGVTEHGAGCIGSFGNYPVLGAKQTPTVGNSSFAYEVHGAAVGAPSAWFLGVNPSFHVDMTAAGITGCFLHVQSVIGISSVTVGPGTSMRGDGTAVLPFPIPNDPSLSGGTFQVQFLIIDLQNGRPLPITMTNALSTTIQ